MELTKIKDVLAPSLQNEKRIGSSSPVLRRVFTHLSYDVYLCLYAGDLLTCLVHFKDEALRIMTVLGEAPLISGSTTPDGWVEAAIEQLKGEKRGPLHLVRDAKLQCQLPLTLHDRAALRLGQVEVPRSAGRFRESFLKES
jgi:hypothetical protein